MDWLEKELKDALARKEPASGFDARVQAAVRRKPAWFVAPRWMAAAAALVVIVGAGEAYRWRRGQQAKDKVMLAMRITGSTLSRAQMQVKGMRP